MPAVRAEVVFNCLALPTISGLFYVRLISVYLHDKRAIVIFGASWIAVFAYFMYDGVRIVLRFASIGMVTPSRADAWAYLLSLLYDTMVYLAVSWQLAAYSISTGGSWRERLRSFVIGEGLPGLAKALLRSGQVYYL